MSPRSRTVTGKHLISALLAGVALPALAGTAAAQQSEDPVLLDPITVQAAPETPTGPVSGYVARRSAAGTKTGAPLIETPQAVTVVTRDQMDDRAVQTLGQALKYMPGVVGEPVGPDARFDTPLIRGFSSADSQFLNGLKIVRPFGATSIEPYGLERIEVLRGPSSVLYGQGNPGGLINLVSKRPTWETLREIGVEAGSFDRYEGSFDIGGAVSKGSDVAFRLTGLARNSGTQVDTVEDDRYFFAPAVTWAPSADTTLTLLASIQHDRSESPIGLPASGTLEPNPNGRLPVDTYLGDPDFDDSDRTLWSIGYEFEHAVDDTWTVRQNARYLGLDWEYRNLYFNGLQADQRTANRGASVQDEMIRTATIDNQLQAEFDTGPVGHAVLMGLDLRRSEADTSAAFGAAPSVDIYDPEYGQPISLPASATQTEQTLLQAGLYVQDQLRYESWLLTLGLRHDWTDNESETNLGGETNRNDAAFSGRAGLTYLFDNGLAPYVSYATSFEPVTGTLAPERGGSAFEPTEGEQYEAGVKYQPAGTNALMTAAVYDLTQSNVATPDPVYLDEQVQTGEVQVRGLELEAAASLAEGLDLIAAYNYTDAEISRTNTAAELGNRPSRVPEHSASLWVNYRFQEGNPLAGFGLGGGVRYVGQRYGDNANTFDLPSNTVYDAAISYEIGGYDLSLNVNNIADEEYVASCTAFGCYYGDGRTVIGKATYRW